MNSITDEQMLTKLEQELLGAILVLDDKELFTAYSVRSNQDTSITTNIKSSTRP